MKRERRWILIGAFVAVLALHTDGSGASRLFKGDDDEFWKNHSVVVAEVVSVGGGSGTVTDKVSLRPLGTLAGAFDVGQHGEVDVKALIGQTWPIPRPSPGAIVVAVLRKSDAALSSYEIPTVHLFAFMPGPYLQGGAMQIVYGTSDDWIDKTLTTIRMVHPKSKIAALEEPSKVQIVIYAEVKQVQRSKEKAGSYRIVFLPKVTLTGQFDAGGTPEVVATFEGQQLGVWPKAPDVGAKVLVALDRGAKSFSVSPGCPDFMPADHAPICVVKDFSDPKVSEALKGVQALRKKEACRDATNAEKLH